MIGLISSLIAQSLITSGFNLGAEIIFYFSPLTLAKSYKIVTFGKKNINCTNGLILTRNCTFRHFTYGQDKENTEVDPIFHLWHCQNQVLLIWPILSLVWLRWKV